MKKKRSFGELEFRILEILKKLEEATVHDVLAELKSDDRYTTVMTVMSRMAAKGMCHREKIGRNFRYRLQKTTKHKKSSLLQSLKQRLFGGSCTAMMSYLISHEASEEELEEIEKLIKQAKKSD